MNKKELLFLCVFSVAALFASNADSINIEPDDNTAAYWELNVIKKGIIEDQSGFGNAIKLASFEKAPLPVVTKEGLRFDNKGGYAEILPKESLRITKGEFSIDVVFKSDSADFLKKAPMIYLIGNKSYSGKKGFSLAISNWKRAHFVFLYGQNNKAQSFSGTIPRGALKAGVFHHVQVSRTGNTLVLFLDGKKLAEKTVQGDISLINSFRTRLGIYPIPWKRDKQKRLILDGLNGVIRYVRISDKGRNGK